MYKDPVMETIVTRTIRSMMANEGLGYADLCDRLAKQGITQSESTLRSKVNNGTLAATLFIHIMASAEDETIDLARIMKKHAKLKKHDP